MKHFQYVTKCFSVVCLMLWIGVTYAQNSPPSPCPEVFQYRYDGFEWFGSLVLTSPHLEQTLKVNVNLSLRQRLPTQYPGTLELYASREQTLQNIIHGKPIVYKIKFPLQSPLPLLTEVISNDRVICSGPPDYGPLVTTIKLEHTLHTQLSGQPLSNSSPKPMYQIYIPEEEPNSLETIPQDFGFNLNDPNVFNNFKNNNQQPPGNTFQQPFGNIPQKEFQSSSPSPPIMQKFSPTPHPPPQPTPVQNISPTQESNSMESLNNICGTLDDRFKVKPLVVGGEQIERGSWPWLAAIYLNLPTQLSFQCGGNLVSGRTIVTSAHCFFLHSKRYEANDVVVYLGRHNIRNWSEKGMVASGCDGIYLHPDYNDNVNTFDADIAIVILKSEVKFTEYIRPVCIWSGPSSTKSIEGEQGIVVGWGRNEAGQPVTAEPRKVSATVVSEVVCIRSNDQLSRITTNRTFCAGNLDGKGPCTGDSGGGLMIRRQNRWMLRGTVSASLSLRDSCNLNEYVVYTDVAKFLNWIQSFILP